VDVDVTLLVIDGASEPYQLNVPFKTTIGDRNQVRAAPFAERTETEKIGSEANCRTKKIETVHHLFVLALDRLPIDHRLAAPSGLFLGFALHRRAS